MWSLVIINMKSGGGTKKSAKSQESQNHFFVADFGSVRWKPPFLLQLLLRCDRVCCYS